MIAASRQTVMANLVQQACAAALILALPNILSKPDFAQVVYVGVLLSFGAFADLGMSLVYGRIAPALHTTQSVDLLHRWNRTTLTFGLYTSAAFAVVISLLYFVRFGNLPQALLLLPVPFLVFWFSFHVGRVSSTGDFSEYRKSITWRALGSLLVIPLSQVLGLIGWFAGTLAAAMLALARLGRRLRSPWESIDRSLVRGHLREGLLLALTSVLWLQLLNFARLYASVAYASEELATYGIIASAYQSVSALLISIFLPISVGILGRYGESEQHAQEFARQMLLRSVPWVALITLLGIALASPVLHWCFPSYRFGEQNLHFMLLCLLFQPFLMVWGNLLIAGRRTLRYLLLIMSGLVVASITARYVDQFDAPLGAASGQLAGIGGYTFLLGMVAWRSAKNCDGGIWRIQALYLMAVCVLCAVILATGIVA